MKGILITYSLYSQLYSAQWQTCTFSVQFHQLPILNYICKFNYSLLKIAGNYNIEKSNELVLYVVYSF